MTRVRLHRSLLTLGLAAAFVLPGAVPAEATLGQSFRTLPVGSVAAKPGFSPVRTLTGTPLAVAVPNAATAEVAARGADGNVVIQTVRNRRATSVSVPVKATEDLTLIDGDGGLWLVSDGQLWRRPDTGSRWSRMALPDGVKATTVADPSGPTVYLAGYTVRNTGWWDTNVAELWRWDGRSWTSLSGPAIADDAWQLPGTKTITGVKVINGRIFAEVTENPPAASVFGTLYKVDGSTWTQVGRTFEIMGGEHKERNAWLDWSAGRQEFLGLDTGNTPSRGGYCWAYGATSCTTGGLPGAGVKVGSVAVLGGSDMTLFDSTRVQGTFWERTASGTERRIPGDPGDATIAIDSDSRRTVYAVTRTGNTYTLQQYRR